MILRWVLLAVVAWLFMARVTMRWSLELRENIKWRSPFSFVVIHLCIWPAGFLIMLSDRLAKSSRAPSQRTVRLLVGESRWHRRERLAREAQGREQANLDAERELELR